MSQCESILNKQNKIDQQKVHLLRTAITPKEKKIGVIIRKKQAHCDLVRYLHATCFSPVSSTWQQAIKRNHFCTWPGLTAKLVAKHLPSTTATIQGHIHRQRQNLQSTKKYIKEESATKPEQNKIITPMEVKSEQKIVPDQAKSENIDLFKEPVTSLLPVLLNATKKINQVAYILIDKKNIKTAYQDLTGRFPIKSSRGNEYILIGYH